MCGPDTSNRTRGGALAVLSPAPDCPSGIHADLAFHTPGCPASPGATHARLTPTGATRASVSDLYIIIHTTGDLRCQQTDCGLFRHFSLPVSNIPRDVALDAPLDIGVGGDGIIGRRVSLCSGPVASPDNTVAQGIVGFNFVQPAL